MKKMMIAAAMLMVGSFAHADGFDCLVPEQSLHVKIYNHTDPNAGTRSAGVMILSDDAIQYGNKTIATFDADAGVLSSKELVYLAKVDLRFANSSRKGENILGTKLGQLATVKAALHFSYSTPVKAGQQVGGWFIATKRNGEKINAQLVCTRYLKN